MADHPHGCGENPAARRRSAQPLGSSPRVWGKRHLRPFRRPCKRIIPTGVGKTISGMQTARATTDHPHGCGENASIRPSTSSIDGSSPRVWGKPFRFDPLHLSGRIIPTGVGKTHRPKHRPYKATDHPHGCGENPYSAAFSGVINGSSPRVWGKLIIREHHIIRRRIIPTGVGKTAPCGCIKPRRADHPHGCGENDSS